jgi:hypothetical protein
MTQFLSLPILLDFILVTAVAMLCIWRISLKDRGAALWPVPVLVWMFLRGIYDLVYVVDLLDGAPFSVYLYNYWSLFIQVEAHISIGILVLQFVCREGLTPGLTRVWRRTAGYFHQLFQLGKPNG